MSVKIRKRINKDGTTTLRLDIYHNGQRVFETIKHLKLEKPSTPSARQRNKEIMERAEAIRSARALELAENNYSLASTAGMKTQVLAWLENYVASYTKKDKRNVKCAIDRFRDYLVSKKKSKVTFLNLTADLIEGFIDHLNEKCKGEGASSYYNRFKRAIKSAYKQKLLKENIFDHVEKKPTGKAAKRDILTLEEIELLTKTPISNTEIKCAALFTLMVGLRWCDIKSLKWENIDLKNRILKINQIKTQLDLEIPLNDTAIKLLKERAVGKDTEFVFNLPSANGANKMLKAWVERAGIRKKITWHNLRHSFGTNLVYKETDVVTVSKLLGHSSLKHTQRYVNAAQEMKERAVNKLNL